MVRAVSRAAIRPKPFRRRGSAGAGAVRLAAARTMLGNPAPPRRVRARL